MMICVQITVWLTFMMILCWLVFFISLRYHYDGLCRFMVLDTIMMTCSSYVNNTISKSIYGRRSLNVSFWSVLLALSYTAQCWEDEGFVFQHSMPCWSGESQVVSHYLLDTAYLLSRLKVFCGVQTLNDYELNGFHLEATVEPDS